MRYKRFSPIARHLLSPKFLPFETESEFFNTHACSRQLTSGLPMTQTEQASSIPGVHGIVLRRQHLRIVLEAAKLIKHARPHWILQASRSDVHTLLYHNRRCPPCLDAPCLAGPSSADDRAVGAATRVSGIDGRTTREQRNCWRGSPVVPQCAEDGVGIVSVPDVAESAGAIAAQVVAMRGDRAATISARIARR